jgi:hypothetical protein
MNLIVDTVRRDSGAKAASRQRKERSITRQECQYRTRLRPLCDPTKGFAINLREEDIRSKLSHKLDVSATWMVGWASSASFKKPGVGFHYMAWCQRRCHKERLYLTLEEVDAKRWKT